MSLKYRKLDTYPGQMSAAELRSALPLTYEKSVIMRSLLLAELDRCRRETVEPRTLRSLWYDLVKPVLSQLGLLDPLTYFQYITAAGRKGRKPKQPPKGGQLADTWSNDLSKYLAELVRLGACTYADLNIKDSSRPKRTTSSSELPLETVEVVGVHHPGVILFTEKTTIFDELEALATIYGISAISGGGEPSFACTENLIDGIEERLTEPVTLHLIGLTDYDPQGYNIFNAQVNQIADVIHSRELFTEVLYSRVGIFPYQLDDAELIIKSYQPPTQGLQKWFDQTGGVNGEVLGLELDALAASQRRRLLVDQIEYSIPDESPYHDDLRQAVIKMMVNDALKDHIEGLRDRLGATIADREQDLVCADDLVRRYALAGGYYIEPYDAFDQGLIAELQQVLNDKAEEFSSNSG